MKRRKNVYFDWKDLQLRRGRRPLSKAAKRRAAAQARQEKQHARIAAREEKRQARQTFQQLRAEGRKESKARAKVESDRELWSELYGKQNPARVFPGLLTAKQRTALRKLIRLKQRKNPFLAFADSALGLVDRVSKKRKRKNSRSRPFIGPDGKVWHSGKRPRVEALLDKAMHQAAKRMDAASYARHMQTLKMLENERAEKKNPYKVTRKFTGGTLKGLSHTGVTGAHFRVGQRIRKPIGGSPYVVTKVTKINPRALESIQAGDRVTILIPAGFGRGGQEWKPKTGRAVMRGPRGWVLNMGGPHGTPGIASEENIVSVKKRRNPKKRKRSRKGKMPAGLAAYWRKKRRAKAKRKNPKKRPRAKVRRPRRRKAARPRVRARRRPAVRRKRRNPPRRRRVKIIKTSLTGKKLQQFRAAMAAKYHAPARII